MKEGIENVNNTITIKQINSVNKYLHPEKTPGQEQLPMKFSKHSGRNNAIFTQTQRKEKVGKLDIFIL